MSSDVIYGWLNTSCTFDDAPFSFERLATFRILLLKGRKSEEVRSVFPFWWKKSEMSSDDIPAKGHDVET
jgi:hypothetical protein